MYKVAQKKVTENTATVQQIYVNGNAKNFKNIPVDIICSKAEKYNNTSYSVKS